MKSKGKGIKRITQWLLCLAVVLAAVNLPAFSVDVKAAETVTVTSSITIDGNEYALYTGFTATAGTDVSNKYVFPNMVDGDLATHWHPIISTSEDYSSRGCAYFEFSSDVPIILKGYILNSYSERRYHPTDRRLYAKANEDDEYVLVSSNTNEDYSGTENSFPISNEDNIQYRYFRFEGANTYQNVWLNEIRLYGENELTYGFMPEKSATCTATGYKQDCYLRSDGKYFTDQTGKTELSEADVIAPIVPHTLEDETAHVSICSVCGQTIVTGPHIFLDENGETLDCICGEINPEHNHGYCGDPEVNDGKDVTWRVTQEEDGNYTLTISGSGKMADYDDTRIIPWNKAWNKEGGRNYFDKITKVVVSDGVTYVGHEAFWDCPGLKTVEIPSSVTAIGDAAFGNCDALTKVEMPCSLDYSSRWWGDESAFVKYHVYEGQPFIYEGDGTHYQKCKCGNESTTPENHNFSDQGDGTHKCADCGATETHKFVLEVKEGLVGQCKTKETCGVAGEYYKYCSNCDALSDETFEVSATGKHTFSEGVCADCGAENISENHEITTWAQLKDVMESATEPTTIVLTQDIVATAEDEAIFPAETSIVLDLNGYTLDRNLSEPSDYGCVFFMQRSLIDLTIKDSSPAKTGVITGGYATTFAGCIELGSGSLTLLGGTITGNKTLYYGGGIDKYPYAKLMVGGTARVIGNYAYETDIKQWNSDIHFNDNVLDGFSFATGDDALVTEGEHKAQFGIRFWTGVDIAPVLWTLPSYEAGSCFVSNNQREKYMSQAKLVNGNWTLCLLLHDHEFDGEICTSKCELCGLIREDGIHNMTGDGCTRECSWCHISSHSDDTYDSNGVCTQCKAYRVDDGTLLDSQGVRYRLKINSDLSSVAEVYGYADDIKESIVIPKTIATSNGVFRVASFATYCFKGCTRVKDVDIQAEVTFIANDTFEGCSNLTSVVIPNSVTEIRGRSFTECSSLTNITIPDGVTKIGFSTFEGCSKLVSIVIPNGVTEIENDTFEGCSSLASINLPDGLTTIGDYAFYGCSSLTDVTIPSSVISVEGMRPPFEQCSSDKLVITVPCTEYLNTVTPTQWGNIKEINSVHDFTAEEAKGEALKSAATCLDKAVYYRSCSVCGHVHESDDDVFEYGSALGHEYTSETATAPYLKSKATCIKNAVYYHKCSRCESRGATTWTKEGSALGHSWGEYHLDGDQTCTYDGHKTAECTREGCSEENKIVATGAALGHLFTEYLSAGDATTEADGHKIAECDRYCGATDTVIDEGSRITETCGSHEFKSLGIEKHKCSVCGTKAAHNYDEATHICSDCNQEDCRATGNHDFVAAEGDNEKHECSVCHTQGNHDYSEEIVNDSAKKSDATCTEKAKYYKSCICGAVSTSDEDVFEVGTALGHSFSKGAAQTKCDRCDFTREATMNVENLTVTAGLTEAVLTWSPVPQAVKYAVYKKSAAGVTTLLASDVTKNSYIVNGLTAGEKVGFIVRPYADGWGNYSQVTWVTMQIPTSVIPEGLTAVPSENSASVSWSAVSGAREYALYQKNADGTTVLVSDGIAGTSYEVTGLTAGARVGFIVRAKIGTTWYGYSTVTWTTLPAPAVPPTGVKAQAGDGCATVTWNEVPGAGRYALYQKSAAGVVTLISAEVTGTSYEVTGLTNGETVGFVLKSRTSKGWSTWSATGWTRPQGGR